MLWVCTQFNLAYSTIHILNYYMLQQEVDQTKPASWSVMEHVDYYGGLSCL